MKRKQAGRLGQRKRRKERETRNKREGKNEEREKLLTSVRSYKGSDYTIVEGSGGGG